MAAVVLARVQRRRGRRSGVDCRTGCWPGLLTDTDFRSGSMATDASRPCARWHSRVAPPRRADWKSMVPFHPAASQVDRDIACKRRCVSANREPALAATIADRLAGVAAAAGLASDDLLGEMNQHSLGPDVAEFVKRPQQAQFEQRLQRAGTLRRHVRPALSVRRRRRSCAGSRAPRRPASGDWRRRRSICCRRSVLAGTRRRAPRRDRIAKARSQAILP